MLRTEIVLNKKQAEQLAELYPTAGECATCRKPLDNARSPVAHFEAKDGIVKCNISMICMICAGQITEKIRVLRLGLLS